MAQPATELGSFWGAPAAREDLGAGSPPVEEAATREQQHRWRRRVEPWLPVMVRGSAVTFALGSLVLLVMPNFSTWPTRAAGILASIACLVAIGVGFPGYALLRGIHAARGEAQAPDIKKMLAMIDSLFPAVAVSESQAQAEETCVVCLELLRAGESRRALRCGHAFHAGCIDRWWTHSGGEQLLSCPTCRQHALGSQAPAGQANFGRAGAV